MSIELWEWKVAYWMNFVGQSVDRRINIPILHYSLIIRVKNTNEKNKDNRTWGKKQKEERERRESMETRLTIPLLSNHVSLSHVVLILSKQLIFNNYQAKIKIKIIHLFAIVHIENLMHCTNFWIHCVYFIW